MVLPACVCTPSVCSGRGGQKRILDPGTGVTGGCELLYRLWEQNWDPLEEKPVFLTTEIPNMLLS